ncbi:MAG: hypothetical protein SGI92_15865, partial [Bryobacteraceae bacterium]|nr:hypothetical protein [Bryobacteraceae bacterium]
RVTRYQRLLVSHSQQYQLLQTTNPESTAVFRFKDGTTLRFRLPREAKGTFDLANTRLKMVT